MTQGYASEFRSKTVEAETRFRDLFGGAELDEARSKYWSIYRNVLPMERKPMVQFLQEETERKLREQDNDEN